jgi:hypothetical protein
VNGLEISFMKRIYPVSALLTGCTFLCVLLLYGWKMGLGVFAGGVFGIVNMILLARLVGAAIRPGPASPVEICTTGFVKFPVSLGLLLLVLWRGWVDPVGFLLGFPLILVAALATLVRHFYLAEGGGTGEEKEPS